MNKFASCFIITSFFELLLKPFHQITSALQLLLRNLLLVCLVLLYKVIDTLLTKVESSSLRSSCFFLRINSRCSSSLFLRYSVFSCSCFSFSRLSSSFFFKSSIYSLSRLSSTLYSSIGLLGFEVVSGGRGPSKLAFF